MTLPIPRLDDRTYQQLLDEALARIPVHTPEWTNYNQSDPGVTLIQVFAFLTESLLYRANYIPERNRRKFLSLLGVPLKTASSAEGIVSFSNARGPLDTVTLNGGLEVRAGDVPFTLQSGLDVLPIETQMYYKRPITPDDATLDYYNQLYVSYTGDQAPNTSELSLYELTQFVPDGITALDLGNETVDGSLWVALLTRSPNEAPEDVRKAIGSKTINLGIVPAIDETSLRIPPGGGLAGMPTARITYEIPDPPDDGLLPEAISERIPNYRALEGRAESDPLLTPTIVQITLPPADDLRLWTNIEPLEAGADDFPPALEDTALDARVVTWLRITVPTGVTARLLWLGINSAFVAQRARVTNEVLPNGTGEPDQTVFLSQTPVIENSVRLTVTTNEGTTRWTRVEDLAKAGAEVPTPDLRLPPGVTPAVQLPINVYTLNPESGEIRFGDGTRGRRPPFGSVIRVDYEYSMGEAGNVGAGAITASPALPAGLKVTNPVRTWGGARGETVAEGEKQITRYLQHRDRLVSVADFETITWRTPGVEIGRVDVLPAYNPTQPGEPGNAAGAVTLLIIPRSDPKQPNAPQPDRIFLNAVCDYLESRRLVTTELFLRGPDYIPIWITVAIKVVAGASIAETREAVRDELLEYLSPLPDPSVFTGPTEDVRDLLLSSPGLRGWPLRKPVVDRELMAVASRVPNVLQVDALYLAQGTNTAETSIPLNGLQLPFVAGIEAVGDATSAAEALNRLRGASRPPLQTDGKPRRIPVPVLARNC